MPLFKGKSSKAKPNKAINYITNPQKAKIITSQYLNDSENYALQFKETYELFKKGYKKDERKYYHFKISADPKDNITPENSHKLAEKLAKELFSKHECVISTHIDTDVVHSHIIVNAVSFETGLKLHINNKKYANFKDITDILGEEMGLTPLNWREKMKSKRQNLNYDIANEYKEITNAERHILNKNQNNDVIVTWKEALRIAIDEAKEICENRYEFQKYLSEKFNIIMPRNTENTLTFTHPSVNKSVRGAKLGEGYTAKNIDKILNQNYLRRLEHEELQARQQERSYGRNRETQESNRAKEQPERNERYADDTERSRSYRTREPNFKGNASNIKSEQRKLDSAIKYHIRENERVQKDRNTRTGGTCEGYREQQRNSKNRSKQSFGGFGR